MAQGNRTREGRDRRRIRRDASAGHVAACQSHGTGAVESGSRRAGAVDGEVGHVDSTPTPGTMLSVIRGASPLTSSIGRTGQFLA